jgi:hypothetical protein
MNKLIVTLMLILGIFFLGLVAAKDYTRSCDCQYSMSVNAANGDPVDGPSNSYPSFSGKGTVGYYNPNEARKRARHNLDECIQAAWEHRDGVSKPTECTESNQIFSYPINNGLIPKIRMDVCNSNPDYDWFTIGISATFSGDNGCLLDRNLWNTNIISNYRVNCPSDSEPLYIIPKIVKRVPFLAHA